MSDRRNLDKITADILNFIDRNPTDTGPRAGSAFGFQQPPGQGDAAPQGNNLGMANSSPTAGTSVAMETLNRFLESLSPDDLRKFKYALNNASISTGATIAIGTLVCIIAPGSTAVAVTLAGLGLMTIGLQYLISIIDQHLDRRS